MRCARDVPSVGLQLVDARQQVEVAGGHEVLLPPPGEQVEEAEGQGAGMHGGRGVGGAGQGGGQEGHVH